MRKWATAAERPRRPATGLCVLGTPAVSFLFFLFLSSFLTDICLWVADAEALQMVFDPTIVSYRQLLEFFYRMHDPTTMNRQGADVGTQYRSAIFTHGELQQKTAEDVTAKVGSQWYKQPLSTQVVPAGRWWNAEDYHQLYLNKNPSGYECPAQYVSQERMSGWFLNC